MCSGVCVCGGQYGVEIGVLQCIQIRWTDMPVFYFTHTHTHTHTHAHTCNLLCSITTLVNQMTNSGVEAQASVQTQLNCTQLY
jgi:hypothetical protein